MKFMLMMHAPKTGADTHGIMSWAPQEIQAHIAFMRQVDKDLRKAGELVAAEGLDFPPQPKIVRAKADRTPAVTDGPFPETKEFLVGFWIIDVESASRAYDIAAHISAAPGTGGAPLNMALEVRQVMSGPPQEQ